MAATPTHRLPRKLVWITEKTVERRNPASGRKGRARRPVVRWREGVRVRERAFDDLVAAGRYAAEKEEQLAGRRRFAPRRTRFTEYTGRFDEGPTRMEDGYLRQLVLASRRLIGVLGDRLVSEYRSLDFDAVRTELNRAGSLSPTTVESTLARIRTIFRAAWKEGLLDRPPEIRVRDLAYEKPVLDEDEIREIFEAAKGWPRPAPGQVRRFGAIQGRLYPILATLYYTMMRRGELIHLAWEDVRRTPDGELEILVQPKEWREPDGDRKRWEPKDREIRAIPVHPVLAEILEDLGKGANGSPWVFTNFRGERWTVDGLASLVVRFEKATGFKVGFHTWRRSGITHLHDAGVPPGQIQEIAGHSSLSTTMRYVRPSAKGRRRAIRALRSL